MTHLLDTNLCSAHVRRPGGLAHRFFQHAGQIAVPTIVVAEMYAGARRLPNPGRLLTAIADLLQEVTILSFDLDCAEKYGEIQGAVQRQGMRVPAVDLMIAAVALVHDLTLVTHNTADYRNVPGLRLVDWLVP